MELNKKDLELLALDLGKYEEIIKDIVYDRIKESIKVESESDIIATYFISVDKRGFLVSKKRIDDMGFEIELVSEQDRYNYMKEKYGFENTTFMGDGIFDVPLIKDCKFRIALANARLEAKEVADFITFSGLSDGGVCYICLEIKRRFLDSQ